MSSTIPIQKIRQARYFGRQSAQALVIRTLIARLQQESFDNLQQVIAPMPGTVFQVLLCSDDSPVDTIVGDFTPTQLVKNLAEPKDKEIRSAIKAQKTTRNLELVVWENCGPLCESGIVGDLALRVPGSTEMLVLKDVILLKYMPGGELEYAINDHEGEIRDCRIEENILPPDAIAFLKGVDPELRICLIPRGKTHIIGSSTTLPNNSIQPQKRSEPPKVKREEIKKKAAELANFSYVKIHTGFGVKPGVRFAVLKVTNKTQTEEIGEMEVVEVNCGDCKLTDLQIEDIQASIKEAMEADEKLELPSAMFDTVLGFARKEIETKITFNVIFGENTPHYNPNAKVLPQIAIPVINYKEPHNYYSTGTCSFYHDKRTWDSWIQIENFPQIERGKGITDEELEFLDRTDFFLTRKYLGAQTV